MSLANAPDPSVPYVDRKRHAWVLSLLVPTLVGLGPLLYRAWPMTLMLWLPVDLRLLRRASDRPRARRRHQQPARGRRAAAGGRPVLSPRHLRAGAAAVGRVRLRRVVLHAHAADLGRPAGHRDDDRHGRRLLHQPGPRAGPQEVAARTLAREDRAGADVLRPLHDRAQPRPPSRRRDRRRPGVVAHGRRHLALRAARDARRVPARVAARARAHAGRRAAVLVAAQRAAAAGADHRRAVDDAGRRGSARRCSCSCCSRRCGPTSS